jgi:lycopene cyclase domain-containing protein
VPQFAYAGMLAFCLLGTLPLNWFFGLGVLGQVRRLVMSIAPVFVVFVLWDVAATQAGHWRFDPSQITGIVLPGGLPLDEVLFFVVVPVCAILGFEAVRAVLRLPAGDE